MGLSKAMDSTDNSSNSSLPTKATDLIERTRSVVIGPDGRDL